MQMLYNFMQITIFDDESRMHFEIQIICIVEIDAGVKLMRCLVKPKYLVRNGSKEKTVSLP